MTHITQEATITRLRMALKPFADKAAEFDCLTPPVPDEYLIAVRLTLGDCRRAREALDERKASDEPSETTVRRWRDEDWPERS